MQSRVDHSYTCATSTSTSLGGQDTSTGYWQESTSNSYTAALVLGVCYMIVLILIFTEGGY